MATRAENIVGTISSSTASGSALAGEPGQERASVLLADSDVATRHGLNLVLTDDGMTVCAEAADANTAVLAAIDEQPDVCLVDLNLPGGGLWAAARICTELPQTPVVMLAQEVSDEDLFDALRLGASGFLLKNMTGARIPDVVRGVLRGEAALPRELVGRVAQEFRERGRRRHVSIPEARGVDLTNREWEVIDLLSRQLSTREIADRLAISQVTVRRHVGAVLKKLQVESRAAALELLDSRSFS